MRLSSGARKSSQRRRWPRDPRGDASPSCLRARDRTPRSGALSDFRLGTPAQLDEHRAIIAMVDQLVDERHAEFIATA